MLELSPWPCSRYQPTINAEIDLQCPSWHDTVNDLHLDGRLVSTLHRLAVMMWVIVILASQWNSPLLVLVYIFISTYSSKFNSMHRHAQHMERWHRSRSSCLTA